VISYVMPTRDRPEVLARTLAGIGALPAHDGEVVIVDNASRVPPSVPVRLANGLGVNLLLRDRNEGAAARNEGVLAGAKASEWIVMLDDDSAPMDLGVLGAIARAGPDVGAVAAEIFLEPRLERSGTGGMGLVAKREAGGLPEVFVGCGVAIRRAAWESTARGELGAGYDPAFGYYAEEYDLCARLLLEGWRIGFDRGFRVEHRKVSAGRDMDLIVRRLVRNNAWTLARYAPRSERRREIAGTIARYAKIAALERAEVGFAQGLAEMAATLWRQARWEMPRTVWEHFIGLSAARAALQDEFARRPFSTAALVDEGKNAHVVYAALEELGVRIVTDAGMAEALVIGTLSPGPMLDALEARQRNVPCGSPRVMAPWQAAVPAIRVAA
jgi:GT2 family glycosyltransferase